MAAKVKAPQYKILYLDIENAPNLGYAWEKYDTTMLHFVKEWYMLCFAYQWAHESKVHVYGLPDFPNFKKDVTDDKALVKKLWEVMNEADLIIAHNGVWFDIRKANTRMLKHDLTPPSPYKIVDTLKLARKQFYLNSNKLGDIGEFLGLGSKMETGGFKLWLGCMFGHLPSFNKMMRYCKQDIVLLRKVYEKLAAWYPAHPNITLGTGEENLKCPVCGGRTIFRGWHRLKSYMVRRYSCVHEFRKCGKWSQGKRVKIPNAEVLS